MTKLSTNPKDHLWNQRAQMCTRIHKQPDWSGGTMRNKEGGKEGRGGGVERGGKEEQMFIRSTTPLCPQLLLLPPFIISLVIVASYLKKPV